jgi:hypothetical protein
MFFGFGSYFRVHRGFLPVSGRFFTGCFTDFKILGFLIGFRLSSVSGFTFYTETFFTIFFTVMGFCRLTGFWVLWGFLPDLNVSYTGL